MEVVAMLFALLVWFLLIVVIAFAIALPSAYMLTWIIEGYVKIASHYNKKRTWK